MYDSSTNETSSLSTILDVFEEASLDFKTQYGIVTVIAGTDTMLVQYCRYRYYACTVLQVQILCLYIVQILYLYSYCRNRYLHSTAVTDTILVQVLHVQIINLHSTAGAYTIQAQYCSYRYHTCTVTAGTDTILVQLLQAQIV